MIYPVHHALARVHRTGITILAVVCAVALGLAGESRANSAESGVLIAELVDYGDVRSVVPKSTEATFARVIGASGEQQQAAGAVIDGARTELARVVNRHQRAARDDPTYSQIVASEGQVLADAATIERQLLSDLRSLLSSEQEPRFEAFERAHRRTLLSKAKPQGVSIDVWIFLDKQSVRVEENEALAQLLDAFDRESDEALVRNRRALLAYYASVRKGSDGTDEARERDRRTQQELFVSRARLGRVHSKVVEPLLALLSPEVADKLVTEMLAESIGAFDASIVTPARFPVVREVLALELEQSQRSSMLARIGDATTRMLSLARECVVEQARYELLDNESRGKRPDSPMNIFLGRASDVRKELSAELLGMLSPEQRRAYDASEVIEPADVSVVKEE
jgi:hypothetical protein